MEHGVVVPGGDVRVRVVDVGVAARALRVQAVGPGLREGGWRREVALRQHMVGPKGSIWMVKGNGARSEVWVDRDGSKARGGLG